MAFIGDELLNDAGKKISSEQKPSKTTLLEKHLRSLNTSEDS